MKYTINEFRKEFPNDDVCLDRIFYMRYSKMPCCPQCSQETTFKRIPRRRAYQCSDSDCQYQLYPTAGTIFEKTRTPLSDWFYAIYLMTSTRNGVAAKEIERQLGVTYKCAFRMGHQIRKLMDTNLEGGLMSGIIEADETYIGGNPKNRHKKDQENYGRRLFTPVLALLERDGKVVTKVLDDATTGSITPLIYKNVDRESTIITDSHKSYNLVGRTFKDHTVIKHTNSDGKPNYHTKGDKHTNSVEGFFSHLKRTIKGTHLQVSKKHLHAYASECAFKYTYRKQGQGMFYTILSQVSWKDLQPFEELKRSPLCELDFLLKD